MSCPVQSYPVRQRKVWIPIYFFVDHITSHHITSQRILIGRWCYCYTVAIERSLQFIISLDLSCVMIWQLIPGHRRKFRLELRKTHALYYYPTYWIRTSTCYCLWALGCKNETNKQTNIDRWMNGLFCSASSFVFFFILATRQRRPESYSTRDSKSVRTVQYSTVQYITSRHVTLRYVHADTRYRDGPQLK